MVDAALAGLAVLVTAVMVALALVRFFAALRPDFLILPVRRDPDPLNLPPRIRDGMIKQGRSCSFPLLRSKI